MSSNIVYDAVKGFLLANWTVTPLVFDNEMVDQNEKDPTGGTLPWVFVEMTSTFYDPASFGAGSNDKNLYREEGTIWLTVMVPTGSGSRIARQYAKQLVDLFRGLELSADTIRFTNAGIGLGNSEQQVNGNWYGLPASVGYQADL